MDQYPSSTKASLSKIWCLECRGIVRERKRLNNSEVSFVSTVLYVQSCGYSPECTVLWVQSCMYSPVCTVLYVQSCGYSPVCTVLYVDFDKIQYRVFRGVSWII